MSIKHQQRLDREIDHPLFEDDGTSFPLASRRSLKKDRENSTGEFARDLRSDAKGRVHKVAIHL